MKLVIWKTKLGAKFCTKDPTVVKTAFMQFLPKIFYQKLMRYFSICKRPSRVWPRIFGGMEWRLDLIHPTSFLYFRKIFETENSPSWWSRDFVPKWWYPLLLSGYHPRDYRWKAWNSFYKWVKVKKRFGPKGQQISKLALRANTFLSSPLIV